jgi:hypothetical protein
VGYEPKAANSNQFKRGVSNGRKYQSEYHLSPSLILATTFTCWQRRFALKFQTRSGRIQHHKKLEKNGFLFNVTFVFDKFHNHSLFIVKNTDREVDDDDGGVQNRWRR